MLFTYRFLTFLLFPAFIILIYLRKFIKKEDKIRYKEKILSSSFFPNRNSSNKLYWFHAASLCEFHQVEPVIDGLKEVRDDIKIIVSFSSLICIDLNVFCPMLVME